MSRLERELRGVEGEELLDRVVAGHAQDPGVGGSYKATSQAQGQTWQALSAGLPLSAMALRRWTEEAETRGGLVPVEPGPEVPEPSTAVRDLTLISPSGYRLVGLDLTAALALLRGLG